MAILVDARSGRPITLAARSLVGRSSACPVRVDDARASGEHARIAWRGERWEVRDLGSRNGTFLRGARIARGGAETITAGDELAFGSPTARFTLIDASPPVALARRLDGDAVVTAADGLLALPSGDEPTACVFEDVERQWVLEIDGQARATEDGEVIQVKGAAYMLHLPMPVASTIESRGQVVESREVALRFRVSRDEERVEVAVEGPRGTEVLPPRAHHYALLTLARARLADDGDARLAEPSRGWLPVDDLCRMLAVDENTLNVHIYRIRQDLAAVAIHNAAALIERRRGSRQIRLGTRRITVTLLG
ncbi:MAG: FHA domain-containing protein [Minicystis sp.]